MLTPGSVARRRAPKRTSEGNDIYNAVRGVAAHIAMDAEYGRALETLVFSHSSLLTEDRKKARGYKKLLLSVFGRHVLTVVWIESRFVSNEDLERCGLSKSFDGAICAWSFAVKTADNTGVVAGANSAARKVGIAAEAFGVIKRVNNETTNQIRLEGTRLLHEVMIASYGSREAP